MKIISHRGVDIPRFDMEFWEVESILGIEGNNPKYIDKTLNKNFDVELDVWMFPDNYHQVFLGHDYPQYSVDISYLITRKENLWIHCKNYYALSYFTSHAYQKFKYFWHDEDSYTMTSNGLIWTGLATNNWELDVLPLHNNLSTILVISSNEWAKEWEVGSWLRKFSAFNFYGICTDKPTHTYNCL